MSRDIRKNGVDETFENHENILDIEDFTTEYAADEEFEKLIRDGLDESWEDLGLTVDDTLIARTMSAIKDSANEAHELPAEMTAPAAGLGIGADTAENIGRNTGVTEKTADNVVTIDSRRTKIRRFTRIAAGIAAAALVGIIGISVLRGSMGMKSSDNIASAPMAESGGSTPKTSNFTMATESATSSDEVMEDSMYESANIVNEGGAFASENSMTDMKIISSYTPDGSNGDNGLDVGDTAPTAPQDILPASDEGYAPGIGAVEKSEEDEEDRTAFAGTTGENDADSDYAGTSDKAAWDVKENITEGPDPESTGTDTSDFREVETLYGRAYPDSNCYIIEVEDLRDDIIEYVESVEGEELSAGIGFGSRSADEVPLIKVVWDKVEEKAAGSDTVLYYKEYSYAVYENDMDYHEGIPVSSALNDYYTAVYALQDGAEVAAHLLEMIDSYSNIE